MIDASAISEHMDVIGSDGQHVGTVDKLCIKLTKSDPSAEGQHHVITPDLAASIDDGKVVLSVPASAAIEQEKSLPG